MTTALALVADCGEAPKFDYVHAHFTAMETKAGLKSLAQVWLGGRAEHMQS